MNILTKSLKMFLALTLLLGVFYPLLITVIAQLFFQEKANGSFIVKEGRIIGSQLIGQKMSNPKYFWPRPSFIDYNPLGPSGGSNLSPTSKKLQELVIQRRQNLGDDAPIDLLYASGSGLDPHITLEAAYFQAYRVAKARGVSEEYVKECILSISKNRRFFKSKYINVLLLNKALDEAR